MENRKNILTVRQEIKQQKSYVLHEYSNSIFSLYSFYIRSIFFLYSVHILSIFGSYSPPIAGIFPAYSDYLYINNKISIIAIIISPNIFIPQLSARSPPISENIRLSRFIRD